MVTKEEIIKALKTCYDPEIPINVYDLGLIYDIAVKGGKVQVKMTLTAPGCPMARMISYDIEAKLKKVKGVKEVSVEVVWDPPWTPDRMTDEAKRILGVS
jgi:FeS assembly SUF system protein